MIQSFKDAATKELFEAGSSRHWVAIRNVALRKLDQMEAANILSSLRVPPAIGWKRCMATAWASTAYESTINTASVSSGKKTGRTRWRLPIITRRGDRDDDQ
jgi:hypothetical protein